MPRPVAPVPVEPEVAAGKVLGEYLVYLESLNLPTGFEKVLTGTHFVLELRPLQRLKRIDVEPATQHRYTYNEDAGVYEDQTHALDLDLSQGDPMSIFSKKSHPGKLSFEDVKTKAEELVKAAAQEALPGEEKLKLVVDQLVQWFDDEVDYKGVPMAAIIDRFDGPILRFVLGIVVHQAYSYLVEKGVLV